MSIRNRLIVIVFLAGIALTAAIAAVFHILSTSDAARLEAAETHAQAAADTLADAYKGREALDDEAGTLAAPTERLRTWLMARTASILSPLPRSQGGFCSGGAIVVAARPGRPDPKRPVLTVEQRTIVERACATGAEAIEHLRNKDVTVVSIAKIAGEDGAMAWTTSTLRPKNEEEPTLWQIEIAILALGTLALVAVSLDALFALRKGAAQLDESLEKLSSDLNAEVPRPRAEELSRITDGLKKMAEHLADAREREVALSRKLSHEQRLAGLGRVVAGVAHEIRNPLAGMKLRLDLLVRSSSAEAVREDVQACLDEVARLDRVVRSLLVVARRAPSAGSSVGEARKELALSALVDERIALALELAKERSVTVHRQGEATLTTDPDALARVLDNVLRNAIEASPTGGTVDVDVQTKEGEGVVIEVSDDGEGVPEAREAEIFEPFFTTKPEGTGLGLWLSRSLIEALSGTLDYARVGARTTFRVRLP